MIFNIRVRLSIISCTAKEVLNENYCIINEDVISESSSHAASKRGKKKAKVLALSQSRGPFLPCRAVGECLRQIN